jgi:1,4-dihydroxy-2-naphthoate octaprenyltransferase
LNQEVFSLRRDAEELFPLLYEGRMLRHGEPWAALPREVVSSAKGIEAVVFEVMRWEARTRPHYVNVWWRAIRPEKLTLTISPCMVMISYGIYRGWEAAWGTGILAILGALFFQISVNLFNDVEDHLRLIDLMGNQGGSRVIQNGWLNARQVEKAAYIALILGVLFGLPAVLNCPKIMLWIGGAGVLGVFAYSNKPFGVKYRALGGVAVFLLGGPLLALGSAQAAFNQLDLGVLSLGCFFGLASLTVNHANNFQNLTGDQVRKFQTLASRLGFNPARHLFPLFYGIAFLGLLLEVKLGVLPALLGIALCASLPWIVELILTVYKASGPASALLGSLRKDAIRVHLMLGGTGALGLLGAYWNKY